jgi:hypothetical protein
MVDTWARRLEGEGSELGLFVQFPLFMVLSVDLMVQGCEFRIQGSWLPAGCRLVVPGLWFLLQKSVFIVDASSFVVHCG